MIGTYAYIRRLTRIGADLAHHPGKNLFFLLSGYGDLATIFHGYVAPICLDISGDLQEVDKVGLMGADEMMSLQ